MARILLVDDEPDLRELIADVITMVGFECISASDGVEALEIVKATISKGETFDLVLSDISMPRMNGFDLLSEIVKLNIKVPVIFLSGHADRQLEQEATKRGAVGIQYKPFKTDQLIDYLTATIASHSAGKEADTASAGAVSAKAGS